MGKLGAIWGLGGVFLLLIVSIYRLTPIAIDAFDYTWTIPQWALLIGNTLFMAYSEGYRGFQQSFSPRTVARARYLDLHPTPLRVALAPLFCMGYFDANRRTRMTTIGLTIGIILFIIGMKFLPQPWRGLLDVGVVVGLSWGTLTLLVEIRKALATPEPHVDPNMP